MKEYLLSIIAAALIAAMVGILSPHGSGKGLLGHLRLLCALFLLCVLLVPLKSALEEGVDWLNGELENQISQADNTEEYKKELENAMNASSRTYLSRLLVSRLESEFSIPAGEVRCIVQWEESTSRPKRVSVILSGSAIWRDPSKIEAYVESLLDCECVSAVEEKRLTANKE